MVLNDQTKKPLSGLSSYKILMSEENIVFIVSASSYFTYAIR